ncbi:two-component system, chemotaxis family, CheB/CheR fusion protein [Limimonas halophila]|uniref:Two-component system, chemotaxis family, CheB/CheR fusion protein n=1 Tax=Limimonas halophila TaxID=1082479 RepID=A0A1G7TVB4_9PROT|nr:CheR family methyltransferase [Limimonas halophila]SDG39296.1 two-component system, chemotaxis family, CheB/CheR fusion protein [Limimonas halophila]
MVSNKRNTGETNDDTDGQAPADGGPPIPIVGIGASAGGVESLRQFLGAMPADSGMAFVVVQHLQHGRHSFMDEVLAGYTAMPVVQAEDGMPVAADRVHLLPSDALLTIHDGALRLEGWAGEEEPRRMPIDTFLRALAEDQGRNAVAVIMSGAGSDGTLGVRAIKEHGGLALAEAFSDTRGRGGFESMPQSAVATGLVDFVVTAREMPEQLLAYARHLNDIAGNTGVETVAQEAADYLREICAVLLARKGRDFRHYKTNTLVRRIQRRMQVLRMTSAAAYVEHLREDAQEVERLAHELLITVTSFFRDPDAFDALKQFTIRPLLEDKTADQALRIWVPGCGTGEEAFSIAVLVQEVREELERFPRVQIFATDIDEPAIESARTGRYPKSVAADIPPNRLRRYFTEEEEHDRVVKDVREMCIFSVHDLVQNPPFSRLDLISCRNVLIYFDNELQRRLIPVFHYALREGGYLFLGASETVAQQKTLFGTVDKKHRIYRRRRQAANQHPEFPFLAATQPPDMPHTPAPRDGAAADSAQKVEKLVLDWYGPAFVVVDEQFNAIQYSRRTGKYLEQPAGAPRTNVLELARPGLRVDLQAALKKASEQQGEAVRPDVSVRTNGKAERVDIVATPISGKSAAPVYLVVFRPSEAPEAQPAATGTETEAAESPGESGDGRVRQLEYELASTKEDLQTTIEELETSNEELKSANEELLSMNEELQSSNEELETTKEEVQSVNEELETVNQELNRKVAELDQTNTDLRNLLQSTDVATVFLDRQANIKWYSPAATRVFNLIDSDVNRPITDITSRVDLSGLRPDIDAMLRSGETIEREVVSHDGAATFAMRVLPYRDNEDRVDGVVLTFVDITDLKAAEAESEARAREARQALADLHALLDVAPVGIAIAHDPEGETLTVNRAAAKMLGGTDRTVIPGAAGAEHRVEKDGEPVAAENLPLQRALNTGETIGDEDLRIVPPGGEGIEVLMTAAPLLDEAGGVRGAVTAFNDITQTKAAERRQRLLVSALQHRVNNVLAAVRSLERETRETCRDLDDFAERFEGRLDALGITETMMARTGGERVDLDELAEETLPRALYAPGTVTVEGPPVSLSRRAGQLMALALNELLTNAIKHGALTAESGRIAVAWEAERTEGGGMLRFTWTERGLAQSPAPVEREGFGLDLVQNGLPLELGGSGEVSFGADGITCTLRLPLDGEVALANGERGERHDGDAA